MSKIDVVRAAMVEAMKAKDKAEERFPIHASFCTEERSRSTKAITAITEDEENAVVKKEIKQSQETYDTAPADREDIREEAATVWRSTRNLRLRI